MRLTDMTQPLAPSDVTQHAWALANDWWMILIGLVLIGFLAYGFARRRNGKPVDEHFPMSDEKVAYVIKSLGGRTNIIDYSVTGSRVSFTLDRVKAAELDNLKDAGASGVFVAGKTVKCMFPEDPANLIRTLENNQRGNES